MVNERPELPPGYRIDQHHTRGFVVFENARGLGYVTALDLADRAAAVAHAWERWRKHGDPAWVAYLDSGGS